MKQDESTFNVAMKCIIELIAKYVIKKLGTEKLYVQVMKKLNHVITKSCSSLNLT